MQLHVSLPDVSLPENTVPSFHYSAPCSLRNSTKNGMDVAK